VNYGARKYLEELEQGTAMASQLRFADTATNAPQSGGVEGDRPTLQKSK
jgi:hypothetical protein